MYTLRTVTSENRQNNQEIGKIYDYVDKDSCYTDFCELFHTAFERKHIADLDDTANHYTKNCFGFVRTTEEIIPLYKDHSYYIMTESGKTFSNLTYK
ncbi:hypothetical protein [Chryseobacterium scophthalmum]|uniref:hypothetical protein n=1 Tax=Chryseobacterium scophthalmum TaxID=59733 RepID=UPI000C9E7BA5|nr:hypothetical protein [Chryseobacterium scophthalmum]